MRVITEQPTPGAQAIDRAARLLRLILAAADPPSFTQLQARSGLPKATTARMLLALERNGLVRRDGGVFRPGPALDRTADG